MPAQISESSSAQLSEADLVSLRASGSARPPLVVVPKLRVPAIEPLWLSAEPLLRRTDWNGMRNLLGSEDELSPRLRLIAAIAEKEGPNPKPGSEKRAIGAVAELLAVKSDHVGAVIIAKRILRSPRRHAPREALSGTSALMVFAMVATAGVIGFFAARMLTWLASL